MPNILQLKIKLADIKPDIWRTFQVEDNITFKSLHDIIQTIMGWEDYHMYEFVIDGFIVSCEEGSTFNPAEGFFRQLTSSKKFQEMLDKAESDDGTITLDPEEINEIFKAEEETAKLKSTYHLNSPISELIKEKGQTFRYVYDFGDNWVHEVEVEQILEKNPGKVYPNCVAGARACPPEDCGSFFGYSDLLRIMDDESDLEYEETMDWLGEDYDPEYFNANKINKRLKKIKYEKVKK